MRLSVVATEAPPAFASLPSEAGAGDEARTRQVYFPGHGYAATRVVRRESLAPGEGADGPMIVESMDSTVVVPPEWSAARLRERHPGRDAAMIDPVTLTIVNNNFVNICREMGITMIRTAFSPIFNEGLDFSCVLFDRRGNMIGQAEFCPAQIAASLFIVRWTIEELGVESFEPGDVVLHNDPYRGGAHIPEHSVMRAGLPRGRAVRLRRPTSATSRRSAARRSAASRPTPPRSSRRGCASRP